MQKLASSRDSDRQTRLCRPNRSTPAGQLGSSPETTRGSLEADHLMMRVSVVAHNHVILGSEIRENWTRRINYLLSEKKTGFWADQYFSCVRQAEVYRAFLTCTKNLVRSGSIQLASGHVFTKRDAYRVQCDSTFNAMLPTFPKQISAGTLLGILTGLAPGYCKSAEMSR
jgi:hypothetical protein